MAQSNLPQEALQAVLKNLSGSLVYTEDTNIETNKKLWNQYAKTWETEAAEGKKKSTSDWVVKMAGNVGREASDLQYLGDEWSDERSLNEVLTDFLFPSLEGTGSSEGLCVAEIGVGGARIASRVWCRPRVKTLHCFDVSDEMLKRARAVLALCSLPSPMPASSATATSTEASSVSSVVASSVSSASSVPSASSASSASSLGSTPTAATAPPVAAVASSTPVIPYACADVRFTLLDKAEFSPKLHASFDVIYSFDVFPHIDLHVMWAYLKQFKLLLKPNGTLFLHTSNLAAPRGFERFSKQAKYSAGGFYFVTPDLVTLLGTRAGFHIVKQSSHQHTDNTYYARDFCVILKHENSK